MRGTVSKTMVAYVSFSFSALPFERVVRLIALRALEGVDVDRYTGGSVRTSNKDHNPPHFALPSDVSHHLIVAIARFCGLISERCYHFWRRISPSGKLCSKF